MGATRPASGIKAKVHTPNKGSQTALITRLSVNFCLKNPDAGRVAPISACVWCLRLVLESIRMVTFHRTQIRT